MLDMRSIEGKAFVGNDDTENRNATQDISSSYSDSHIVAYSPKLSDEQDVIYWLFFSTRICLL